MTTNYFTGMHNIIFWTLYVSAAGREPPTLPPLIESTPLALVGAAPTFTLPPPPVGELPLVRFRALSLVEARLGVQQRSTKSSTFRSRRWTPVENGCAQCQKSNDGVCDIMANIQMVPDAVAMMGLKDVNCGNFKVEDDMVV